MADTAPTTASTTDATPAPAPVETTSTTAPAPADPTPADTPATSDTTPVSGDSTTTEEPTETTPDTDDATRHNRTVAQQLADAKRELAEVTAKKAELQTAHEAALAQLKQEQAQRAELENVKTLLANAKQEIADIRKAHAEEIKRAKATALAESGIPAPISTVNISEAGMTIEKLAAMSATEVSAWKAKHPAAYKKLTQPQQ